MKRQTKMENGVPVIHTNTRIKGFDACKLIRDKHTELSLNGYAGEKSFGVVISILINELAEIKKIK